MHSLKVEQVQASEEERPFSVNRKVVLRGIRNSGHHLYSQWLVYVGEYKWATGPSFGLADRRINADARMLTNVEGGLPFSVLSSAWTCVSSTPDGWTFVNTKLALFES